MREGFAATDRLSAVRLARGVPRPPSPEAAQEIDVALYDLAEENRFRLLSPMALAGPYAAEIALSGGNVLLSLSDDTGRPVGEIALAAGEFAEVVEDHRDATLSYMAAVRSQSRAEIEAADAERRAVHDDGAAALSDALAAPSAGGGGAAVDHPTARRLFTLLTALLAQG